MRNHRNWGVSLVVASLVACCSVATVQADDASVRQQILRQLNLSDASIETLDLPMDMVSSFEVVVPVDGVVFTANLWEHSVRAPGFHVLVTDGQGGFFAEDPGPIRTVRGELAEVPGSILAGSLLEDGLWLLIQFPDGDRFWIEPIGNRVPGAQFNQHVIYSDQNVIGSGGTCKLFNEAGDLVAHADHDAGGSLEGGVAGGLFTAQLAIDADVQYFQNYGTVNATQNQIQNVINTMNVQYQNQTSITHLITGIIVRTTEPDGYTSTNPGTMLNEMFSNWCCGQNPSIQRDAVQLFTGKNMQGTTIGVAWLGGMCSNSQKYSVVESNCGGCFSFACKTDLSAHELGHQWNANHCCAGSTMNSSLVCANNFATSSINTIVNFRNNIASFCLDVGQVLIRIILTVPATVNEGASAQLSVIADFNPGPDTTITNQVSWSVSPPSAGSVNGAGLFTAGQVNGDTVAIVTATYNYNGQIEVDSKPITIIDLTPPPDPRKVMMTLVPGTNTSELCPGENFTVAVRLSSLNGSINDLRLMQFDSSLVSGGITLNSVTWNFESLASSSLYFLFSDPPINAAAYTGLSGIPGFIVNLTGSMQTVATLNLTYLGGSGSLNICGPANPASTDFGTRFTSEFDPPVDYNLPAGNLVCTPLAISGASGDACNPLQIISSVPPTDAVDARQPSNPDGSGVSGFTSIQLFFDGDPSGLTPADFLVQETGGNGVAPTINSVLPALGNSVVILLNSPLEPVTYTTFTHLDSGTSVSIGYLPADVNGDGFSSVPDVLALIDSINGVTPLPSYSTDIDRSGVTNAADVLRVIDLLNGAGVYPVYNGVSLP